MTDDKIVKDAARNPEREALGPGRGGIRAAAKRAAGKVAKKVVRKTGQKKVVKKTTAAAGRTAKKATRSAARTDKPAAAKVATPASRATSESSSPSMSRAAPGGDTPAASAPDRHSAATVPYEPDPTIETQRPPGPVHRGAAMDTMQEHAGGFGSLLALWGPLLIVAFLVLVFRGGEERESTVAAGPDAASRVASVTSDVPAPEPLADGAYRPAGEALPDAPIPHPIGTAYGPAEAYDGGFAMRTSMATPVFAGRGTGAGMPPAVPGRLYPSPPGPYRDPRYRSLPTGESWSAGGSGEWMWSAEGRGSPGRKDGGDAPVQWVRCAPPYYWCPAPSSPTW